MRKYIIGFIFGCALSVSVTAFAAPVQQFILTKVLYPIMVNGEEYTDEEFPALNYEGRTYIPLAKVGDLLGVNYKWNDVLGRVDIFTDDYVPADPPQITPTEPKSEAVDEPILSVTDGTGQYAGYKKLLGHPYERHYHIYFKGDASRYTTTIEEVSSVNMGEIITWNHGGKTYKNSRKELYAFFSDTSWFSSNLNGVTNYTLTQEWFEDVFGEVYFHWADGIGVSSDAERWVERYFKQTGKISNDTYITLTPDMFKTPPKENEPSDNSVKEDEPPANSIKREKPVISDEWVAMSDIGQEYGLYVYRHLDEIRFYTSDIEIIYTIEGVLYDPPVEEIVTFNDIRYRYVNYYSDFYFNRDDLKKAGIIN